jgi:hypothetical protein
MRLRPLAHLKVENLHDVIQHPQQHQSVRLGLMLDEDVDDESASALAFDAT